VVDFVPSLLQFGISVHPEFPVENYLYTVSEAVPTFPAASKAFVRMTCAPDTVLLVFQLHESEPELIILGREGKGCD
jgi:hypothetical protein